MREFWPLHLCHAEARLHRSRSLPAALAHAFQRTIATTMLQHSYMGLTFTP